MIVCRGTFCSPWEELTPGVNESQFSCYTVWLLKRQGVVGLPVQDNTKHDKAAQ